MSILLKNLTSDELHASLSAAGVTPRMARQIQAATIRREEWPSRESEIPLRVLDRVRQMAEIPRLTQIGKVVSPSDGFAKYLFQGAGPEHFEAVCIPILNREDPKCIVCVSSQAGCALNCAFCATGRMGFQRDLATWEIVDQVIRIRTDSPHPVRGVVFMGMGEPFLNYDAVMRAARILAEPCGLAISGKAITISTAGIVPGIRRFTSDRRPYRLFVSLTFADPMQRLELMPVERAHPLPELIQALREYHNATGRRVTIVWTMMSGVNVGEEDARKLADLTRGLPLKLDLIDVNDPSGRFKPPTPEELSTFRDALRKHLGMPVARRYSGGQDIQAACGMLSGACHPSDRDRS